MAAARTTRRRLVVLAWIVGGAGVLALATVAIVTVFFTEPDRAENAASVQGVADLSVVAAEGLNVAGAIELLCEPPMNLYRMSLETLLAEAQTDTGTDTPQVDAEVTDVSEGPEGSFLMTISSDEPELADRTNTLRFFVENRDGRSCIVGRGSPKDTKARVLFSGTDFGDLATPTGTATP